MKCRIYLLLLIIWPGVLCAQQNRFGAAIILGLNAAQINGDNSGGYNKLGLRVGLRGIARLNERAELSMDLLYSQRGSRSELVVGSGLPIFVIHLEYAEVPIRFTYRDWYDESKHYYKVYASGGVAYSRLLQSRFENTALVSEAERFNANDVSVSLAIGYMSSPHVGFQIGWSRSLVPLYNNRKWLNNAGLPRYPHSLWPYFLSFEIYYAF